MDHIFIMKSYNHYIGGLKDCIVRLALMATNMHQEACYRKTSNMHRHYRKPEISRVFPGLPSA